MKFQIEKDAVAPLDQAPDDVRSGRGEELLADLVPANRAAERVGERERVGRRR